MNQCEDRHEVKYKITYKPVKGQNYCPEWLVCEHCYEKRPFSSDEYIQSIQILGQVLT